MARGNHNNGSITLEFTDKTVIITSDSAFYSYDQFKVSKTGFLTGLWSSVISYQSKTTKLTRDGFYRDKVAFIGLEFIGGTIEILSKNEILIRQNQVRLNWKQININEFQRSDGATVYKSIGTPDARPWLPNHRNWIATLADGIPLVFERKNTWMRVRRYYKSAENAMKFLDKNYPLDIVKV